jgi:hypothetical protein
MATKPDRTLWRYTSPRGFMQLQVWKDIEGQWYFDGPSSLGPPHVRRSGRGPAWRGGVTERFALSLLAKLKESDAVVHEFYD